MSLINEALRKSTRQPTSFSARDPAGIPPSPQKPKGRFFLWASLGVTGLLLLFWIGSLNQGKTLLPRAQEITEPTLPSSPTEETGIQRAAPPPPSESVSLPPPQTPEPASPRQFLTLNGVVMGGDNPFALINNQAVQKGEEVEGYVLKEVLNKKVMLEKDGETLELRLQ